MAGGPTARCRTAGAKDWVEPTSKRKEASDRRQDAGRAADGKTDQPGAAAKRVSSADRHEREKAKPSSGMFYPGLIGQGLMLCPVLPSLLPFLDPEAQSVCLAPAFLARQLYRRQTAE